MTVSPAAQGTAGARTAFVPAALAVLVAALIAGCGSSANTSTAATSHSGPPSPSPSASASPSATPSGPAAAPAGQLLSGIALTVEEANRFGSQPVTTGPPPSTGIGAGPNATLDLCAASYPSEALRTERYQIAFVTDDGQHKLADGNEIVRYRSGGTTRAYHELVAVARSCQAMTYDGVRMSKPTIVPVSPKLVHEQLTVAYSQSQGGQTVFSVAVYQYLGDLFDGVYVTRGSAADALSAARSLAVVAAGKLRGAPVA